jgi:hypothetical protein
VLQLKVLGGALAKLNCYRTKWLFSFHREDGWDDERNEEYVPDLGILSGERGTALASGSHLT